MSLHSVKRFTRVATNLPAVTMVAQWGSHVAKVGGKVFALIAEDGSSIVFKVSEMSFEVLSELEDVTQAPYFAKRAWVQVGREAPLSDVELTAYIAASHEMIAAKLTRKARAELGLTEPARRS